MATTEERRDQRFNDATITALKDIHERGLQYAPDLRYPAAYGILKAYMKSLLINFAASFSEQQLGEIRIVLDQLTKLVREDEHLDDSTKAKLDQLAQALRESE